MRKLLVVLFLAVFLAPLLPSSAQAGGPPPKDILKGVFTEVDAQSRTATFRKDPSGDLLTLTLGADMKPEDVRINKKAMVSLDKHAGEGVIKDISIMFMDMTPGKIIALIVVGLIGGLLSGFIGSGGAFVLTPAMMSLGAPGAVAVASNMCHKFPKAMVGTYKRFKYGQVDLKLAAVMAVTAIIGVQIGIMIQKYILRMWGNAGSNLYVSVIFVIVLVLVGGYVCYDAYKLSKKSDSEDGHQISGLALRLQKLELPPMMHFKVAKVRISAWVTVPVGLATGMLAATIAVGGFIGVPGMIYVIGASAVVASATELGIAFIMGAWGSIQWGLSGLIDIRMTLLILSASLIGVQLGALGTTYVKDYMIKIVMAATMLIVAISRGAMIPGYLADLGWRAPLDHALAAVLDSISFWALVAALGVAGGIITVAMVIGMMKDKAEKRMETAVSHG
jgi:uncharacterized membrane protein YfcA